MAPERASAPLGRGPGVALLLLGAALVVAGVVLALVFGTKVDVHSWSTSTVWTWFWMAVAGAVVALVGDWLWARAKVRRRDTPQSFLNPAEEEAVVEAIRRFEQRTSGELRVHLSSAETEVMAAARQAFESLGLTATRERNGVLFFVAVPQRTFAVLGDLGIHQKVSPGFWNEVVGKVQSRFAQRQFGPGLAEGIALAGEALAAHFPPRPDDVNELPDQISRQ